MKPLVAGSMATSDEMPYQERPSSSARPIHISFDCSDHGGAVHSVSRKIRRVIEDHLLRYANRCAFVCLNWASLVQYHPCISRYLANANRQPANGRTHRTQIPYSLINHISGFRCSAVVRHLSVLLVRDIPGKR
jgi:hypothetical protein